MVVRVVRISQRIYATALRLLPETFRSGHGVEMEALFRDRAVEAGSAGIASLLILVVREVADVLRTSWRLRRAGVDSGVRSRSIAGWSGRAGEDIGAGARQLARHPLISLLAVGVIALGIGATTSTFAIVDSVALRPLAHEDPDRLVVVGQTVPSLGTRRVPMAWPNYRDLRARRGTGLADMAAFRWPAPARVSMGGSPEVLEVTAVSGGLFSLLGNRALHGRAIEESDDSVDAAVVVLGHALWRSRFGGDRGVVGRTLTIEGEPYEVVGVMGPGFSFPAPAADLFIPMRHVPAMNDRDTRFLGVVARLEPGVSLSDARRRMDAAMDRLVREWPVENEGNGIRLDPLRSVVLGESQAIMFLLLGAVALLLILSCASVVNLLLARMASREAEFAMRRALGAGRVRLATQLLGEGVVLAGAGGLLGLVLSVGAVELMAGLVPGTLPRASTITFDVRSYGFAAAATIASGLFFGAVPAIRTSAGSGTRLRQAAAGVVGRSRQRLLRGIVVGQVAVTVMLLVGGGLLLNSYGHLVSVDRGMDTSGVATVRVDLSSDYEDPRRIDTFFTELVERSAAMPGVTASGATWALPFTRDWASGRVTVEGDPRPRGEELMVGLIPVRGQYFEAMGMRLVEGRVFEEADYTRARAGLANLSDDSGATTPPAGPLMAVINEAAARAMWPGARSVVSRRFRRGRADEPRPWITVIGVVADAKRRALDAETEPEFYQMHPQALWAGSMSLVVRAELDATALVPALREIVRDLDPALAVTQAGILDDFVSQSVAEPRFRTILVATFGAASLVLALAGVYGVLAFTVSLRTREIGVRMALGAGRSRVLGDVLREGGVLVGTGLTLGLVGAAAASGVLRSQLFGVGRFDRATWTAVVLLMVIAGIAACWVPAHRASRVEPATAMRDP